MNIEQTKTALAIAVKINSKYSSIIKDIEICEVEMDSFNPSEEFPAICVAVKFFVKFPNCKIGEASQYKNSFIARKNYVSNSLKLLGYNHYVYQNGLVRIIL